MHTSLRAAAVAAATLASTLTGADAAGAGGTPLPDSLNDRYDVVPLAVSGDYVPIVGICGDVFILWYAPGAAPDYYWRFEGGVDAPPTVTPVTIGGDYMPVVGNFDGSTCVDIVWYGPGAAADYVWWNYAPPAAVDSEAVTIGGQYRPVTLELDDVGLDDIFWYAPGPAPESVWEGQLDQSFDASPAPAVNGDYRVASVRSSLLFHQPGAGADYVWGGVAAGAAAPATNTAVTLNGTYEPFTLREDNFFGAMLLYGRGAAPDQVMHHVTDQPVGFFPASVGGSYTVGLRQPRLSDDLILWHAPGAAPDYLWVEAP